jgi:hypothetical protein
MTRKGNRERLAAEIRYRRDRHERERREAEIRASEQRRPIQGLQPIPLDSIADQLDEVDPKIRAALQEKRHL